MLRPATPLAIIFFLAFVLLLLSTISTPIIKAIPLGSFQGYDFGVFGWCNGNRCEGPRIGYNTDGLFSGNVADDFSLPSSTRTSLSSILIVHPIAALLVLICFSLAVAAHFHAPGHSPRFLLALLILTIPTLLVTLLAFLVDILLFVPHVEWGGWIMLAATILIVASSVVTCAMRRTLVSRKARKKRIAENADMNGANYYENLNQQRMLADQLPRADSPPPMSGSTQIDDPKGAAQFATFEMKRQETLNSQDGTRRSNDDRTPLNPTNPARDPSIRSASTGGASRRPGYADGHPPMPMNGRPGPDQGQGMGGRQPMRDEYGNPLPPMMAAGMAGELPPPGLRHHNSQGSLGSNRSGQRGGAPPPGYMRGRGGYGPPPRGYGPPRGGAYGPRGGYGPPRGGYGPRGGFRGGPPPPGWNGRGRGGYGPGGPGPRGPPPPPGPPGYGAGPYYGPQGGMAPVERQRSQDQFVARGPSPGGSLGIGRAIEMDERTGSPPEAIPQQDSPYGLRDSDGDVAGMVDLQQNHPVGSSQSAHNSGHENPISPTSVYSRGVSSQQYVPARAAWTEGDQPNGPVSPPAREDTSSAIPSSNVLAGTHGFPMAEPLSPIAQHDSMPAPRHVRSGSEHYYEDVDPRFASDPHVDAGADQRASGLPSALQPGANAAYPRRL